MVNWLCAASSLVTSIMGTVKESASTVLKSSKD
jgi:hypothetical protein